MYCPKCGQETINIGGKEACTTCGILYEKVTPVDQITSQIREKAINNIPKVSNEEYVSPTQAPPIPESPKTVSNDQEKSLDKFIKTWGQEEKNGEVTKENQNVPAGDTASIPDFPTLSQKDSVATPQEKEVLEEASNENVLNITEENIPTKDPVPAVDVTPPTKIEPIQSQEPKEETTLVKPEQPVSEKVTSVEGLPETVIPLRPEFAQEIKVQAPMDQKELFDETQLLMENSEQNPEKVEENIVYPSHNLNLAVIKAIFITIFIMLIIVAILYIYRANISFSDIVLDTATFMGENLFK